MNHPKARRKNILVQPLPNETLLFDTKSNQAIMLAPLSQFVWNACDGTRSAEDIVALASEAGVPADLALVQAAIENLSGAGLLESTSAPMSRRAVLGTAAAAAAAVTFVSFNVGAAPTTGAGGPTTTTLWTTSSPWTTATPPWTTTTPWMTTTPW